MLSAKPGGELVVERIYKAFSEIGYTVLKPNDLKNLFMTQMITLFPKNENELYSLD